MPDPVLKPRRRIMTAFKWEELSSVDRPAMVGALATLMKRREEPAVDSLTDQVRLLSLKMQVAALKSKIDKAKRKGGYKPKKPGGARGKFEESKHPRRGGKFTDKPGGHIKAPKATSGGSKGRKAWEPVKSDKAMLTRLTREQENHAFSLQGDASDRFSDAGDYYRGAKRLASKLKALNATGNTKGLDRLLNQTGADTTLSGIASDGITNGIYDLKPPALKEMMGG